MLPAPSTDTAMIELTPPSGVPLPLSVFSSDSGTCACPEASS